MKLLKKIAFVLSLIYTVYYIVYGLFTEFILYTAGYAKLGGIFLKPNVYILIGITVLLWYLHIKITKKTSFILVFSIILLLIGYNLYPRVYFSKEERYLKQYIDSLGSKEDIKKLLDESEKDFSYRIENQIDNGKYQETKTEIDNVIKNNTPFYIDEKKFVRIFPEKLIIKDEEKYDAEPVILIHHIQLEANFLNSAINEFGCTIDESIVNDRNKYMDEVNTCINKTRGLLVFRNDQALLLFEMTYEIFNKFGNNADDEYPYYK